MDKESTKKAEIVFQRQILGLKFANALLSSSSDKEQVNIYLYTNLSTCYLLTQVHL